MSPEPWTPEEFARLMALPEGHPERERAKASPAFEAWCRMHEVFSAPTPTAAETAELAATDAELARRLAAARPAPAEVRSLVRERAARRGWDAPAIRFAVAAALLVVVGTTAWLGTQGPGDRRLRGDGQQPGAFELAVPRLTSEGEVLEWAPSARAESYRIVFYGHALEEIAHVDVASGTRYVLRPGALVPGLVAGDTVRAVVQAVHAEAVLETSPMRELRVP